ncbi:MAG TPA: ribosome-associated translation inhibitor RaiA [Sphingobium sp.]|uniref:ribosome hibernation-promoting factor, HPF/YfiA family n=1 Tax=Sphingobium sp. TaxID=1912891 RepID=UPI002ECFF6E8
MDIRVSGHQVETGGALQTHVSDRLSTMTEKYFSRAISAQVTFGQAPHGAFHCDIVSHVNSGIVLKGAGEAQDAHLAFERAADRIDTQLRRYKQRLKDRHGQSIAAEVERAQNFTVDNAAYTVFRADEEEEATEAPVIVAETRVDVPEASVSDAVMMLDLRNTNALLFLNSGTSTYNMVYRRMDGTIGWVEPHG